MEIVPIIPGEIWSIIGPEQICYDQFLTISFEKLSSLCCNNVGRIASLPLAGWNPSSDRWPYMRYQAAPLPLYMVRNVNVNFDFCSRISCELFGWLYFRLSCELFGWLTVFKYQVLEIIYHTGGRWRKTCQLGSCTNQRWGARVWTHQKYVLPQWFFAVVSEKKGTSLSSSQTQLYFII